MSKLFKPLQVGNCQLQHRLAMAPLTRYRCDDECVPLSIVKEYYVQRACVPGTLIISEGVQISPRFANKDNAPGIWNEAQVSAWKEITDAVHAKGCFIWCQLWVAGRAADPDMLRRLGHKLMSSSAVAVSADHETPEAMNDQDIASVISDYAAAAQNAIRAGFDGVELHGGNGYLPDQFLQPTCNRRTDKWGGSLENRSRFIIEVITALAEVVGPARTALRLSPWSDFLAMGMEDPVPQFTHVVEQLQAMGLAFLDLIEARIRGNDDADCGVGRDVSFLVHAWKNTSPILLSGGFQPESAAAAVDKKYEDYDVVVVFGRYWTSNPDLVFRIKERIDLQKYDRSTFYTPKKDEGYADWSFSEEFKLAVAPA